ncbi:helix-turn-helix domain-containing protein [Kitasatospora paracochleata]|uniref:Excisionase family DNA binding protein n=1 Tax=Kitasatospora paracochleata TaxID=58354 RepID=A0ABT1IP79_9ACTN|nr:helix-turn-helix domain-containing protein [Kitasatospora paracochleata]MCP2306933.1 excisionase family DNA binding protein [Kitasatospora paracochleata]
MATAAPEALTVPEVMAALRLSRSKVYDLIRSKTLTSFTIGRCRRVAADDLTTYIRNQSRSNA